MPAFTAERESGRRSGRRARRAAARAFTVPWWLSATARTIASPSPEEPERSPWARKKRSKTLSCSSGGMPGPSSSTASTTWPLERSTRRLDRRARVGVAQRVLHQVQHEPVQLVLHALDLGALDRGDRDLVVAGDRLELGGGRGDDVGEVDRRGAAARGRRRRGRAAAGRRPGGASGGSSAARRRRPPGARRVSVSSSSSRLASTEVSGVRSSCEASATNSRWRSSAASVSVRASSSACSIDSSVVASSATSSSASGRGIVSDGVARALDLAGGGGELGDRLHRAPRGGQAGEQRERGAAEHAEAEEQLHAVGGRRDVGDPAPVLDAERCSTCRRRAASRAQLARLDPPAVDLLAARASGCPSSARRSEPSKRRAVGVDHADRRVVAGGVGVEVDRRACTVGLPSSSSPSKRVVELVLQPVGGARPPGG